MNILKGNDFKTSFIGISLGGLSTIESAAAVLDRNLNIITLEKLFSMSDVKYFINNFAGKQNSIILVSIPENEIMISSKWKYNSRTYNPVNLNKKIKNTDGWTNRFSQRGCDYFKELNNSGIDIFRFDIDNMKKFIGGGYAFRERTPWDCRTLQDILRIKYNMRELPVNMLPIAQLEAIIGAFLAQKMISENSEFACKQIGEYDKLPIIGV